ncbi:MULTISPECIES: DUF4128 domain-containing protein [Pseudomonas]|uniref:DUF4128 domain-containing protein n=1 Tax=Pseudomonas TaxID=286 RepID=UPI0021480259|nr:MULTISPECIES: DUF4128 domain-containing protein [Pseudomonas]UUT22157.1 DUF4128 domain-containing protein [Pseudomonas sp. T8]
MSDLIIRSLFEKRLKAWADARIPKLPIAFENVPFTAPTDGSAYLKAFLLPGDTDSEDLEGRHTSYRGVFQVSVVTKAGNGRGSDGLIAEELQALFPNNLELSKSGFSVFVRSPMATASALQSDTTSTLPLRLTYRADTF